MKVYFDVNVDVGIDVEDIYEMVSGALNVGSCSC